MVTTPRLTNIFSKILEKDRPPDESLVVIEATRLFPFQVRQLDPCVYQLRASAKANMYTGTLKVKDGIIREVTMEEEPSGEVNFTIHLEAKTEVFTSTQDGLPARVILHFSRQPLQEFYQGKRIVLDPGHGGADGGYRGPVDLWERDVVWITAQELLRTLQRLGAEVVLTRGLEENPSWEERVKKAAAPTDLFVSIHTHGAADRKVRGAAVLYNSRAERGSTLAYLALEEIMNKTKIPGRGVEPCRDLELLGKVHALLVETVTITSWVDEGILRNPYFHRKLALAVANSFYHFISRGAGSNHEGKN